MTNNTQLIKNLDQAILKMHNALNGLGLTLDKYDNEITFSDLEELSNYLEFLENGDTYGLNDNFKKCEDLLEYLINQLGGDDNLDLKDYGTTKDFLENYTLETTADYERLGYTRGIEEQIKDELQMLDCIDVNIHCDLGDIIVETTCEKLGPAFKKALLDYNFH